MGTGTNIFDASFQQLERFRATGAGSRALVDKLNGPVDWINRNHGVMPVPQQVMPERRGGVVAGGVSVQAMSVRLTLSESIVKDVVVVRGLRGGETFVALPYLLRRTPFEATFIKRGTFKFSYSSGEERTATSEIRDIVERQSITMRYLNRDIIYVVDVGEEIVLVPEQVDGQGPISISLLDLNVDGRMWAAAIQ